MVVHDVEINSRLRDRVVRREHDAHPLRIAQGPTAFECPAKRGDEPQRIFIAQLRMQKGAIDQIVLSGASMMLIHSGLLKAQLPSSVRQNVATSRSEFLSLNSGCRKVQ